MRKISIDINKAKEMYDDGISLENIAKVCGVGINTVRRRFKESGIEVRSLTEAFTLNTPLELKSKEWLIQQYITEDKALIEIANHLNISESCVSKWITKHGISKKKSLDEFDIYTMYDNGLSVTEITEITGYTHTPITNRLKEKGYRINPRNKNEKKFKGTMVSHNGKQVYLRSTWELLVFQYLKRKKYNFDVEVRQYKVGDRRYCPDFFVYKNNGEIDFILEVKGWLKDTSATKMLSFQTLYPNIDYYVWGKDEIKEIQKQMKEVA
jgi:transposase-like protein